MAFVNRLCLSCSGPESLALGALEAADVAGAGDALNEGRKMVDRVMGRPSADHVYGRQAFRGNRRGAEGAVLRLPHGINPIATAKRMQRQPQAMTLAW
jgi:hypothetical protein